MTMLYISLIFAVFAGLGRQITVFGKFKKGLWLFSNWHWLRIVLTSISIILAGLGAISDSINVGWGLYLLIVCLNVFTYFFDMSFFFPEIKQVKRISASLINIDGSTEVIGVKVGETPAAYPINEVVMPRHIVHDVVGGIPVLISYCALCRSALAFKAEMAGQKLYFQVAGVWRRNMIIIDAQTKSIWQQATGECIFGQFKGEQLELLSGENTIWKSWQKKYPHSEFASECVEARKGLMSRKKMLAGLKMVTTKAGAPGFIDLNGLPKRETVFGIAVNGKSTAYPISELDSGMNFSDKLGDVEIDLQYDGDAKYLSATEKSSGEPIIVEKHWWLSWKEFHPHTEIWKKDVRKQNDL